MDKDQVQPNSVSSARDSRNPSGKNVVDQPIELGARHRPMSRFPKNGGSNSMHFGPSNRPVWSDKGRQRTQERGGRNEESGDRLTWGPRFNRKRNPREGRTEADPYKLDIKRDKYNLPDFCVEYSDAYFYIMKPVCEDDVHKAIKYNVWSSTPSSNKKLDIAFFEAEDKVRKTGQPCPIFLFFSVNRSRHFLGVAEMVGPVDFTKDMDFWQAENWMSFIPIEWHIIKDVPEASLCHIYPKNSEGRAVTHSWDAREIDMEAGLEMLRIFKNYSETTSMLDDLNFYERLEHSMMRTRRRKGRELEHRSYAKYSDVGDGAMEDIERGADNISIQP